MGGSKSGLTNFFDHLCKNNIKNMPRKANKLSKKQLALQKKFDLANEVAAAQLSKPKSKVEPPAPSIVATASLELVAFAPTYMAAESSLPKKRVKKRKEAGGPVGIKNAAPKSDASPGSAALAPPDGGAQSPQPKKRGRKPALGPVGIIKAALKSDASPGSAALAPPDGGAESPQPKKRGKKSAGGPVGIINAALKSDASPGSAALALPDRGAESLQPKKRQRKPAGGPVGIINAALKSDASPGSAALALPDRGAESLQPKKRQRKPAGGPVGIINAALKSDASPGSAALAPPDGSAESPQPNKRRRKPAGGPVASPKSAALAPPDRGAESLQPKKRQRKPAGGPVCIINGALKSDASPGSAASSPPDRDAESPQPKKRRRKPAGGPVGIINAALKSDDALKAPPAKKTIVRRKSERLSTKKLKIIKEVEAEKSLSLSVKTRNQAKTAELNKKVTLTSKKLPKVSRKSTRNKKTTAEKDAFKAPPAKKTIVRRKSERLSTKQLTIIKEVEAEKSLSLSVKTRNQAKTAELNKKVTLSNKKLPKVSRKSTRNKKTTAEKDAFKAPPAKKTIVRRKSERLSTKKLKIIKEVEAEKSLSLSVKTRNQAKTAELNKKVTLTSKKLPKVSRKSTRNKKTTAEKGMTDLVIPFVTAAGQSTFIVDQVEVETLEKEPLSSELSADPNFEVCPIDSRKPSLNSDCLSWTKDIPSTSTSTCVTKAKLTTNEESFSSSSDSDSSCSGITPKRLLQIPEIDSLSLNLSASSITPTMPPCSIERDQTVSEDDHDKITYVLAKLESKLKNFDLEMINWIGYNNEDFNIDGEIIPNKVFDGLKEEREVIDHCRQLKKILSNNASSETDSDGELPTSAGIEENKSPTKVANIRSEAEGNITTDAANYILSDENNNDNDTLQLFAESLTGIDSFKCKTTATSFCNTIDFDDYEPPVQEREKKSDPQPITFKFNKPNLDSNKMKTVCEKQIADSTSVYKDTVRNKSNVAKPNVEKYMLNNFVVKKNTKPLQIQKPVFMASIFKLFPGRRTVVFRSVCFFNLLDICKNRVCRFPHHHLSTNEIEAILVRLSDKIFFEEYILLRNWPNFRRKYGLCFVQECKRRAQARFLVEMAIDFIKRTNYTIQGDVTLKVTVVECVLMHLNTVDLNCCSDLLMYNVQEGVPLCDIFMQAIANTQDFSKFEQVFLSLTKFILSYERTFILDVASQILERLCVLTCEQPFLEALVEILKHTDYDILDNCMIEQFEKQLLAASAELHQKFLKFWKEVSLNRKVLKILYETTPAVEPLVQPLVTEREIRDTANRGSMIKRTSISNDNTEEYRPMVHQQTNNRRNMAMSNNPRRMAPMVRRGNPRPPSTKRHIHQQRPGSSQNMRKSPGPEFF